MPKFQASAHVNTYIHTHTHTYAHTGVLLIPYFLSILNFQFHPVFVSMHATQSWHSVMEAHSPTYIRPVPEVVGQDVLNELEERCSIVGEYCPTPTVELLCGSQDTHFIVEPVSQPHECGGCSELRERMKSNERTIAELKKDNVELKKDNVELKKDNVELKKENEVLKESSVSHERRIMELSMEFYLEKVHLIGVQLHDRVCRDDLFPKIEAEVKEFGCRDWKGVKAAMSEEDWEDGVVSGVVNRGTRKLFGMEEEGEEFIAGIRSMISQRISIAHPRGTSAELAWRLERYMQHVEKLDLDEWEKENLKFLRILVNYVKNRG
eukprot:TRINITY_DN834_c0_g1_i5.p1 TRINITY_DN834_c0_g1~~TRINITY_DN834_c0_g1_i5.p1  ORF type:complete len:322 (-),score=71.32 TRINITY_DN834_c0_g1_i5:545-1510(-)